MSPRRVLSPLLLAAAVAVGASACRSDSSTKANISEVRSVVIQFAAASDARACDLLTGNALVNVYGGFTSPPAVAKAKCVKRSAGFKGEPITITKAQLIDNQTAKVNALSTDGRFTYSVTVRRPRKTWLIDQITLRKVR